MRRLGLSGCVASVAASLVFSSCADFGTLVQPRPFAMSRAHVDEASPRHDVQNDRFLAWAEDVSELVGGPTVHVG